jgi:hypothetical protein
VKLILNLFLPFVLFTRAYAFDLACASSYPEVHKDYPDLVCRADRLVNEGEFVAAEKIYLEAANLDFFESPNFEIYMRVARAQCLSGRFTACKKTLINFEQMLNIYAGKKSCSMLTESPSGATTKTIRVMCGELLENTYGHQTEGALELEKSYRKQIRQLRRSIKK